MATTKGKIIEQYNVERLCLCVNIIARAKSRRSSQSVTVHRKVMSEISVQHLNADWFQIQHLKTIFGS